MKIASKLVLASSFTIPALLAGCDDGGVVKPQISADGYEMPGAEQSATTPDPTDDDEDAPSGGSSSGGGVKSDVSTTDDAAKSGTITGIVRFEGNVPEAKLLPRVESEPGCNHDGPAYTEYLVVNGDRLQNAVVWVNKGFDPDAVPPVSDAPVVIDQNGCIYTPHVTAVRVGQKLLVRNSDATNHNVHAKPRKAKANGSLNRTHPKGGADQEWTFDTEEIAVKFACDLHPWMNAQVAVVDHPYFAVTGEDGSFRIEGLEPGSYEVRIWHETVGLRPSRAQVEIPADGGGVVDFTYKN